MTCWSCSVPCRYERVALKSFLGYLHILFKVTIPILHHTFGIKLLKGLQFKLQFNVN